MVTDQVTMHHGQRTSSTKMLWLISQITSAIAPAVPMLKPIHNQRANRAPARMAAPIVITTLQAAMPMSALGKLKMEPCQEARLVPHPNSTLKLQDSWAFGSWSRWILSIVSVNAAAKPITPAMIRKMARAVGRWYGSERGTLGLCHAPGHAILRSHAIIEEVA